MSTRTASSQKRGISADGQEMCTILSTGCGLSLNSCRKKKSNRNRNTDVNSNDK